MVGQVVKQRNKKTKLSNKIELLLQTRIVNYSVKLPAVTADLTTNCSCRACIKIGTINVKLSRIFCLRLSLNAFWLVA